MQLSRWSFLMVLCLCTAVVPAARGQCFIEVAQLQPPAKADTEAFGDAVAISGSVALVGAPEHAVAGGIHQGTAFVYRFDGAAWALEAQLTAADGAQDDDYGEAVVVEDDLMAIGAPFHDAVGQATGAVYVYRYDGVSQWLLEQKLLPSNPVTGMGFGSSIALWGDRMAIGAPSSGFLSEPGRVFIFEFDGSNWSLTTEVPNPDATPDGDAFGNAVALDGDRLVVAAELDKNDAAGLSAGALHVIEYDSVAEQWIADAKLTPDDPASPHYLGHTVTMSGDTIVAGAWSDSDMGPSAGSIYVFQRKKGGWAQEAELYAPDADRLDQFGRFVTMDDQVILAGASRHDNQVGGDGAAYVLDLDGGLWTHEAKLISSDSQSADRFGSAVGIDGDTLIIGARNADAGDGGRRGKAYIFTIGDPPFTDCNGNGIADACEVSSFVAADCDLDGVLDECEIIAGSEDCNGNGIPDECEADEDCNTNGIRDICELAAGTSEDCDGNGVPDACDIARGAGDDCNDNGVLDSCEFLDCNSNGVLDACDLASGASDDCNSNGIPDGCEITDYQIDDGTDEGFIFQIGDLLALNRFTVGSEGGLINSVSIAWSRNMVEGNQALLLVYDDPDNDGDPIDAVLLSSTTVIIPDVPVFTPGFDRYLIEPVDVGSTGDSFFIGAVAPAGNAPAARQDTSSTYVQSSWIVAAGAGQLDVEDLLNNTLPPEEVIDWCAGCAGQWLLRADGTHPWGVPPACELRGDLNDDGIVNVVDLLVLISLWGPCADPCPPFCNGDTNGDCIVGVIDLLALLGNWSQF